MIHMQKTYGMASAYDLSEFEKRRGILLPDEYKKFLMIHNGGRPQLGEFVVPGWGTSIPNIFYGVSIGGLYDIEKKIESFNDAIPYDKMIPIGNDPGGNQLCLGVGGEFFGKIYFWDHNAWDDDDLSIPIEIAPSWEGFLKACAKS